MLINRCYNAILSWQHTNDVQIQNVPRGDHMSARNDRHQYTFRKELYLYLMSNNQFQLSMDAEKA
jgi:hypothetical protein